ncbi:MAG: hypothetical protein WC263_05380, partial [Candidatus Micrarchaeia archaeon]
ERHQPTFNTSTNFSSTKNDTGISRAHLKLLKEAFVLDNAKSEKYTYLFDGVLGGLVQIAAVKIGSNLTDGQAKAAQADLKESATHCLYHVLSDENQQTALDRFFHGIDKSAKKSLLAIAYNALTAVKEAVATVPKE